MTLPVYEVVEVRLKPDTTYETLAADRLPIQS